MQPLDPNIDVRQLVRWLGVDGARAGLSQSKRVTIDWLRKMAENLNVTLTERMPRQLLIDEVLKVAARRIDKSLEELFAMDQKSLLRYFEEIEVEPDELLNILKELNLTPRREGRQSLLDFAARELSETGRFMRIAGKSV